MKFLFITTIILISSCVTKPVEIMFEMGKNGEVYPVVDGEPHLMTEEEKEFQIKSILDAYCS